eukprot:scaffold115106_cov54-Phaeocystis_antarctica.AAC.1
MGTLQVPRSIHCILRKGQSRSTLNTHDSGSTISQWGSSTSSSSIAVLVRPSGKCYQLRMHACRPPQTAPMVLGCSPPTD